MNKNFTYVNNYYTILLASFYFLSGYRLRRPALVPAKK